MTSELAQSCTVLEMLCEVQKYAWGKLGMNSEVARLSKEGNSDVTINEGEPYAELWMGAHPKAPSRLVGAQHTSLIDFIHNCPNWLGDKVLERFKGELPYLFKVLSVNKSLSIQAHPDKGHAEKLFADRPDIYKDPNHKPEMAIALTPFEGLCGFRPLSEIQDFLKRITEFSNVVGQTATQNMMQCSASSTNVSELLKACFENVMKCKPEVREKNISDLVSRLSKMDPTSSEFISSNGELLLRLNSQFPGDVGCFVIYFLNHIKLQPGEAMFLGANEPHAYLDGNCIECMACSDNVVRAGLTPKLIDVPTLCEMLNYTPASPESKKFPPVTSPNDPYLTVYNPPVDDFAVHKISVPASVGKYTFQSEESASILLIVEGHGTSTSPADFNIRPGAVFLISANASFDIALKEGLLAFRALCML